MATEYTESTEKNDGHEIHQTHEKMPVEHFQPGGRRAVCSIATEGTENVFTAKAPKTQRERRQKLPDSCIKIEAVFQKVPCMQIQMAVTHVLLDLTRSEVQSGWHPGV